MVMFSIASGVVANALSSAQSRARERRLETGLSVASKEGPSINSRHRRRAEHSIRGGCSVAIYRCP